MHIHTLSQWQHGHDFVVVHQEGEHRTQLVLALTAATMIIEIIAGNIFGSMALLADGWHMATHVAAFSIAIFAYRYARRHANDQRFSFGTGKVNVLGGFASAVALAVVALIMAVESINRLYRPEDIRFNEALVVAIFGLVINLICAFILGDHHHEHDAHHEHHHQHNHDHNLRAAYIHVLADALTSVLAISALLLGKYFSLHWTDPIMGIVGAAVITHWSYGLLKETSAVLLDHGIDDERKQAIKKTLEQDADTLVADVHIWKLGPKDYAALISLVTHYPKPPEHYKNILKGHKELSHITVEVNPCLEPPCKPLASQPF
jgi:cation diffusion facilitator family transporter